MSIEITGARVVDFDLRGIVATLRDGPEYESNGRSAHTLAKTDEMSVVLTVIAAGASLREHKAPGSVALTVIDGKVAFASGGDERELGAGAVVVFAGGLPHSVRGMEDSAFLLAIARKH